MRPQLALVALAALITVGCRGEQPDPLAEHLASLRQKAVAALERDARRDMSLDILCWDLREHPGKHREIKKFIQQQTDLDVLALAGDNPDELEVAANMEATVGTFDRGWPVVASIDYATSAQADSRDEADGTATAASTKSSRRPLCVINANGFRFEPVEATEIEGWRDDGSLAAGSLAPPPVLHLHVRYTELEFILVFLTATESVTTGQLAALEKWIEQHSAPVIIFGEYPIDAMRVADMQVIEPQQPAPPRAVSLCVSKAIESWDFKIETLEDAFGSQQHRPVVIRCRMRPDAEQARPVAGGNQRQ